MEPILLKLLKGGQEGMLIEQGWTKKTTLGEPRLSEVVENYRNMGYEVHVIEHPVETTAGGCNTCFTGGAEAAQMYGDIYVRLNGAAKPLEDELF